MKDSQKTNPLPSIGSSQEPQKEFSAFISYNSRDRKTARKLRRQLLNFKIPPEFHGQIRYGNWVLGKGLLKVFRDRDSMGSNANLSAALKENLKKSYCLIVICSKACAHNSLNPEAWVNQEIDYFRSLPGQRKILPLILDGEPFASYQTNNHDPSEECIPQALLHDLRTLRPSEDKKHDLRIQRPIPSQKESSEIEKHTGSERPIGASPSQTSKFKNIPLGADYRKQGDGPSRGIVKLVSGITDINFPILWKEEQRLIRKRRAVFGVALALLILCLTCLTTWALIERKTTISQKELAEEKEKEAKALTREANRQLIFAQLDKAGATRDIQDNHILSGHQYLEAAQLASLMSDENLLSSALVGLKNLHLPLATFLHGRSVNGAMPSGENILTWSFDGTAKLWNLTFDSSTSVAKKILQYEIRTGTHLGPSGIMRLLKPPEEVTERRHRLNEMGQ